MSGERNSEPPGGHGDDMPPSGDEARAQRGQTIKPLLWLVVGLVLVAVFVFFLAGRGGHLTPQANSAGPPAHAGGDATPGQP